MSARPGIGAPPPVMLRRRATASTASGVRLSACVGRSGSLALRLRQNLLNDLEPLELRVAEVERLVAARARVRGAERFRAGPGFEGLARARDGVRGEQGGIFGLRAAQQVEGDKARNTGQVGVAPQPDGLEG